MGRFIALKIRGGYVLSTEYYVGIDVGSATTKVVVIDENEQILFDDVRRSGVDFNETVK